MADLSKNLRDAFADLDDVAADAGLEDRVVRAATRPPSPAPRIAAAALVVVVAFVVVARHDNDAVAWVEESPRPEIVADGRNITIRSGQAEFTVTGTALRDDATVTIGDEAVVSVVGRPFERHRFDVLVDVDRGDGGITVRSGKLQMRSLKSGLVSFLDSSTPTYRWSTKTPATTTTLAPPPPTLPLVTAPQTTLAPKTTALAAKTTTTTKTPEPATEPTPTPPEPTLEPAPKKDEAAAVKAVLDEVMKLRRAGHYDDAIAAIDGASVDDARARATLSVERGLLLERAGREVEACAWWRQHQTRFSGPHKDVDAAVARCDDEVP